MHIKMMVVDDAVSLTMNQILTESALTDKPLVRSGDQPT